MSKSRARDQHEPFGQMKIYNLTVLIIDMLINNTKLVSDLLSSGAYKVSQ